MGSASYHLVAAAVALGIVGCSDRASPDRGYDLRLRVVGAQVVRAPFPAERGGPKLTFVDVRDTRVGAGDTDNPIVGRAAEGSFAINAGVEGDPGYWTIPVGLPDDVNPGELQFKIVVDYARSLAPGPLHVLLQAVDGRGVPGPISVARLEIENPVPDGPLVFNLEWDAEVDADLIVVDPTGITIGSKNISSLEPPPPGAPLGESDGTRGGRLDQDSNANCVIDGRRRESIYWSAEPLPGRYAVYAALSSTCGLSHTAFRLRISHHGQTRAFSDFLYASDGRAEPLGGPTSPGLLVTVFDVP